MKNKCEKSIDVAFYITVALFGLLVFVASVISTLDYTWTLSRIEKASQAHEKRIAALEAQQQSLDFTFSPVGGER